MTDRRNRQQQGSPITVGDVEGTGIVIGHGSSAVVAQLPAAQIAAVELLDEVIRQLELHPDSVTDPDGVLESARDARSELAEPSPRWSVVRGLLRGVAAGVVGISTLADAVDKVQALIAHLTS
jgi:hypothetical protein